MTFGVGFVILWILIYPVLGADYLVAVHHTSVDVYRVWVSGDETGGLIHYSCPYYDLHKYITNGPFWSVSITVDVALWTTREVEYKGILVTASNSEATVIVSTKYISFAPLPTFALGTKYIVSSCYQSGYRSLLVIAAYNHTTSISINTRSRLFGPSFKRENTRTFELKPFQTFTFEHSSDLSGTVVASTQPIAVFSGMSNNTFVTAYEQMLPVSLYDKEYVVAVDDNIFPYYLQILSEQNNTRVTFNNGSSITVDSNVYQTQLISEERFYFQSSNPVMTTICRRNGEKSGLLFVPPISLYPREVLDVFSRYVYFLTRKETFINSSKIEWTHISNTDYKIGELKYGYIYVIFSFNGCNLGFYTYDIFRCVISRKNGRSPRVDVRKSYLVLPNRHLAFLSMSTSQAASYQVVFPHRNQTYTRQMIASTTDRFYIEEDMGVQVGVENKAILVEVDSADTHLLFGKDYYPPNSFSVFPTSLLGRQYIVQACYGNTPTSFQVTVVSSSSDTDINVLLSHGITYDGVEYKPGDTIRVRLQPYQTLTLNSSEGLCGTFVSASLNVAVFTFSRFVESFSNMQLLPVDQFGQMYIVTTSDKGYIGEYTKYGHVLSFNFEYYILITSAHDVTQVIFSDNLQVTVKKGISYRKDLKTNESLYFSSTKPVMASLCTDVSAIFQTEPIHESACTVIVPTSLYTTLSMFVVTRRAILNILTDSTDAEVNMMWSNGSYRTVTIDINWETHTEYKVGTATVDSGQLSISSTHRFTTLAFTVLDENNYLSNIAGGLWNPVGWNDQNTSTKASGDITTVDPASGVDVQDVKDITTAAAVGATLGVLILILLAVIICQQIYIRRTTGQMTEKADIRSGESETSFSQNQPQESDSVSTVSAPRVYSELHTGPQMPNTYESVIPSLSVDTVDYETVE